ncbi:Carbohydrate-binding WSC [Metarhizium album ARSEF 1941]|uniref:Carbohydrate-binding WSC n=1 Tax=Metarhizium album (strain ARSEF 1941) TaxID=1081103 RepID=A0A0B2WMY4_METAS|nr:Carbohydrate-binding WSC [Metarhizium album ARSEF 1941]KHN97431.1 Carbohydrate-binding WSC [Metarhizium album ARSEF 1941]
MIHAILAVGLMAASASAQARYASDGFKYVGCVQARACEFPVKMDLGDSFTIAQCQQACGKSSSFAAATVDGCHCEDPMSRAAPVYDVGDDTRCSRACRPGDADAGQCGGPVPADRYRVYNVYQRVAAEPAAVPRVTLRPAADATPAARKTAATHAAETAVIGTATGASHPPASSHAQEHLPPSPAETRGAVACSNCTAPAAPTAPTAPFRTAGNKPAVVSLPSRPCRGAECPESRVLPLSSKAAPAAAAPSHSVIVSGGPCRPAGAIAVALGMAAFVLAVGMS